jgi:hypothetical protein
MAKKNGGEKKLTKAEKLLVFPTKEAMSAFKPWTETKGGNPIQWRYWYVAGHYVIATSKADAVKKAFLAGVLGAEVVEVVKSTPEAAKAALESLTQEERAAVLKQYK